MRKLLWIGDAAVSSGFARATHYTLETLRKHWDVSVLGLNYKGDPHSFPYPIYPCFPGGDLFGLGRMSELVGSKIRPDVIVVQNDPWNFPAYLARTGNVPMIGTIAVDGKNCAGRGLNGLALALFWTKFGEQEAKIGGYSGKSGVIPLGVDLKIYKPMDKIEARKAIGLPEQLHNAFIIGNVNRNQPRKRLDLCMMYFAEWIRTKNVQDAYFFFHTAPTGENGYDVSQLAQYFGIANRLILAEPEIGNGVTEDNLCKTYNSFDVMMTTTQGEGFGLPMFEGMACGIPQIVPDWSALGELGEDAVLKVPCSAMACTPNKINVIGGIMDRELAIDAMDKMYRDEQYRNSCREKGFALVNNPRYDWGVIGEEFNTAVETALYPTKTAPKLTLVK